MKLDAATSLGGNRQKQPAAIPIAAIFKGALP